MNYNLRVASLLDLAGRDSWQQEMGLSKVDDYRFVPHEGVYLGPSSHVYIDGVDARNSETHRRVASSPEGLLDRAVDQYLYEFRHLSKHRLDMQRSRLWASRLPDRWRLAR